MYTVLKELKKGKNLLTSKKSRCRNNLLIIKNQKYVVKRITLCTGIILVLVVSINPVFAMSQLERVEVTDPRLVNSLGLKISDQVNINQQVQISADIKNNQDKSQKFVYIVQIKDQNDVIVKVDWISGSLNPGQTFSPALSWISQVSSIYTAEIFVWDDLVNCDALSEFETLKITS
jgi:hypothetical protein